MLRVSLQSVTCAGSLSSDAEDDCRFRRGLSVDSREGRTKVIRFTDCMEVSVSGFPS